MSEHVDCERFEVLLSQVLDLELERTRTEAAYRHYAECPSCRSLQSAEIRVRNLLKEKLSGAAVPAPPQVRMRILVAVHKRVVTRRPAAE